MVAFFLRSCTSFTLSICACPLGGGGVAILIRIESPPRGRAIRFYSSPPEGGCGVSATIPHAIKIHSASVSPSHSPMKKRLCY